MTTVNPIITYELPSLLVPVGPGEARFYCDIGESLSQINRKLFSQQYSYRVKSVRAVYSQNFLVDTLKLRVSTAGDTWAVQNAWTKAKALHSEMQDLVLDDNPSIKGTWADFKVYLDSHHAGATNLQPIDVEGNVVKPGEWSYATFVLPQHEVDAAGSPLPADETTSHLLGPDLGVAGSWTSVGLVQAYAESRATVQATSPNVPATFVSSFFNLLTDSGSQEPELATVIEGENDEAPYDMDEYPGGSTNSPFPVQVAMGQLNVENPNFVSEGFDAQCGLLRFDIFAQLNLAPADITPSLSVMVELERGSYKGIAATPMGQ